MVSPRFSGIRTFMRLPHREELDGVDLAIVGVPFDTGATYRVGARFGPEAIRSGSALLRPYNPAQDIQIFEHLSIVDAGDLRVVPGYLPESVESIAAGAARFFESSVIPVFLGGDHTISWPLLRAAAATHGPLALVHFDSHSDLWDSYFGGKDTHGTPFRRALEEGAFDAAHSIQVGLRGPLYGPEDLALSRDQGLEMITGPELHERGVPWTLERIRERVAGRRVYLSFDIDFVDPAYAPGTGTPEVGGFTGAQCLQLLRGLADLDIAACDLVEVLPAYDPAGITALLAANLVYELVSLLAMRRKDDAARSARA